MSQVGLFQGKNIDHMILMVDHMILQEVSNKSGDDDVMDTGDVAIGNSEKQLCFSLFSKFIKEVRYGIYVAMVTHDPIGTDQDEAIQG